MDGFLYTVLEVIAGILLLILALIAVNWFVKDARRRGKSPLLVILAIFLIPGGWIAWLLFRPEPAAQFQHR
jgi:hypothetical protein